MCLPTQEQKKRKYVLSELKGILSKAGYFIYGVLIF